jgi:serine/threonine-protein kinase
VQAFRRKIAPYLFVNGVILVFAIFGQSVLPVTVLWSIYIAFKYAKLWSEGYDWRDVFRQPRDREVMEVIEEAGEWLRAVFDPGARARLRANREQRKMAARMSPPLVGSGFDSSPRGSGGAAYPPALMDNALADRVRQAFSDRDEIFRRMESLGGALPSSQREEISRSAMQLAEKVQSLALAMDESSRMDITSAREQLESEISTLENAANPLERGSEDRVRRLAYLKRQRRALVDADTRRKSLASKLETCALALQNMRFDLMRLGASPQMHQHITGLANQAMQLADNVDEALFVADEMGRLGARTAPNPRRPSERG